MIEEKKFIEVFNKNKQLFIDDLNEKYFGTGQYGIKSIEYKYLAGGFEEKTNKLMNAYKFIYTENSGKWGNELYISEDFYIIDHSFYNNWTYFGIKHHKLDFEDIIKNNSK